MTTSNNGLNLIKSFEGCRLTAYRDAVGIPTIGYGHIKGVKMGQTITQAQAEEYLRQDLRTSENAVMKWDSLYHWTQGEFDALVSFTFNCGAGNLNKLVANGTRTKKEISMAILLYDKAKGKQLAGLTRRRKAEKALYDGGATNAPSKTETSLKTLKIGSKGDSVKLAQTLLNSKGYSLVVDGIFGAKTDAAVRDFQQKNIDKCVMVDGIIGRRTWQALTR